MNDNMDYKKLAEDARIISEELKSKGYTKSGEYIQSYADAIEALLERVEQMKNLHMKVQLGYEELSISELCNRLERMKNARDEAVHDRMAAEQKYNELYKRAEKAEKERDKAISDFHKAVKENGFVSYDVRDCIYYGLVENTTGDLVNFYAESKDDIESEFHKAVDDYLEFCKEIGKEPKMSGGTQ